MNKKERKCRPPVMVLLCLLLQVVATGARAQTPSRVKVTIGFSSSTLDVAMEALKKASPVNIAYDGRSLRLQQWRIGAKQFNQASLSEVLDYLLQKTTVEYREVAGGIVLAPKKEKQAGAGKISGRVVDDATGEPVIGATVRITDKGVVTDVNGHFSIALPGGSYTAGVSSLGYGSKEVSGIDVKEAQLTELNVTLKRKEGQLQQVTVTSSVRKETVSSLYARQKNNASTTDGISREQIQRTPDNNVAQVLSRVSGINMQDNKFTIVRGLSDRYNNVMLNGSPLPSTEPNARNFAFDVIPSSLVDNVTVYKTATADISGEFSGGIVEVNTREIPVEDFLRLKLGTGFNTKATGKDFYQPQRGRYDYLGFDDKGRQLPSSYNYRTYARLTSEGYYGGSEEDRQQYAAISAQFPNRFKMYRYTGRPMQDYELSAGKLLPLKNNNQFGLIAAITYRNDQTAQHYIDQILSDEFFKYEGDQYLFNTTTSGMLNMGFTAGKNKISFKNMYSHKFSERSNLYLGQNLYDGSDIKGFGNFPLYNTILQHRLEGEHLLGKGLKVKWNGSYAMTKREEPDNKGILGSKQPGSKAYGYIWNNDNLVYVSDYFSELQEHRYSWGLDLQQSFTLLGQPQLLKAGYQGSYRDADFSAELFTIRPDRENTTSYFGLPYYDAFGADKFGAKGLFYYPYLANPGRVGQMNGYTGIQRLNAAYVMLDGRITKQLRISAGVRMEKNDLQTATGGLRYLADGTPVKVDTLNVMKKADWLPSVNLIYALTPKINLRASYYATVARPDFKEMAFFEYYEPDKKTWISGNRLQPSNINNWDVRFEYYPSPQEIISISGFYKRFKNPIELQMEAAASRPDKTLYLRYTNLEEATDLGLELNFRKSLGFITPASGFLSRLYLSGNVTVLDAKVKLKGEERTGTIMYEGREVTLIYKTAQERPLFGQAPYIINGGLLYAGEQFGVNLAYSRTGPRIITGSELEEYNEWEGARDVLDMQVSYRFLKGNRAEVKLNASDLFNQPLVRYFNNFANYRKAVTGKLAPDDKDILRIPADPSGKGFSAEHDELRKKYWYGRNFSMSISYNF